MFHVKRALLGLLALVSACRDPGDLLYEEETVAPTEVSAGLFRLTANPGGDFVRGTTADGRILYVAVGVPGGAAGFGLRSLDPERGTSRSEDSPYAFPGETVFDRRGGNGADLLVTLLPPLPGSHWCGGSAADLSAPAPPYVGWRLTFLPAAPGPAVASLPQLVREFPVIAGVGYRPSGVHVTPKRIRLVPAIAEADSIGTNPWGPAVSPDGLSAYVSDAATVWRYALDAPGQAPMPVTTGAYPVLSPDGTTLYVSRAVVTDSTETVTVVPYLDPCVQTLVEYTLQRWTLVALDLHSGTETAMGEGAEAVPVGDTALIVRRADGLHRVRLADGTSVRLVADSTAGSPALAADGSFLTFSATRSGNRDVMLLRLN